MFLLVSVRHVGVHLNEHQHGVSIQISINLGKHFFGYLVYEIFLWPESWRGSLHIYLLSFPRFWTLSIERFWFLFWSILNGMTLKTRNKMTFQTIFMTSHFFQHNSLSTTTDFYDFLISSNTITVNNNSPIQDYVHPDDQTQPTFIIKTTNLFIQRWMKKFSQSVFLSDCNFIVVN